MTAATLTSASEPPQAGVIALIDSANFYVSCERVFRPDLARCPVAVLSNNDGCIIARSEETKALGIRMGAPYFQVKDRLRSAGATVFSSNYALYADFSDRVASLLEEHTDALERYSIDECFVGLPRLKRPDQLALSLDIHRRVLRGTGIPVRVGTGPTKVLAKIAQQLAKAHYRQNGQPVAHVEATDDALLAEVPVEDVWGIGPASSRKLRAIGATTARDLRDLPDAWVRRALTVVGLRLVWELRGVSCLPLEEAPGPRKSLIRSRSFGEAVSDMANLREAVSTFASRAAEKLRRERVVASVLQTFITTGRHAKRTYSRSATVRLLQETNYTPDLVQAALAGLERIYAVGYRYKKAGVVCLELRPEMPRQTNLFAPHDPKQAALMAAMDAANQRYGRGAVFVASCGASKNRQDANQQASGTSRKPWQRREAWRSPSYTTRKEDLRQVQI